MVFRVEICGVGFDYNFFEGYCLEKLLEIIFLGNRIYDKYWLVFFFFVWN